ncbi:hypothetical protein SDC9_173921 [bioreactor metagenome]|uniref:Uncharacterized protein n=1 Tax=bioreactor metagenome TaxID=1076179 RepID=A0A645GJT5_9ZZZZ
MACFLVPTAEAIVATIVTKSVEKKEKASAELTMGAESAMIETEGKIPFSRKLKWLTNMLWGGSALLAFEHVWHGEVVPWFPFLTAASNPADASVMLHEMATVGVSMAVLVTVIWAGMVAVSSAIGKGTLDASGAQASIG